MRGQETNNDALSSSEASFADLRETVASIADDLKQVVEVRGRAAKEQAEEGVQSLREAIRRQPALAIAVALLAGAALALIAAPSTARRSQSRWASLIPSMPSVTRADLYDFAEAIQRKTVQAASSIPLASSLERVADALSKVEPSALSSAFEKFGSWFQQMRTAHKQ